MKIVFIVRDPVPSYGIMSISAFVKKAGHQCEIIFAHPRQDIVKDVKNATLISLPFPAPPAGTSGP